LQDALLKCRTPILDSDDVQTFKAERLKQERARLANFEPKSFRRARVTCAAVDADPFLWVVADYGKSERYCIGVWDERGFIQ
jgi:hypothetical protein